MTMPLWLAFVCLWMGMSLGLTWIVVRLGNAIAKRAWGKTIKAELPRAIAKERRRG